MKRTTALSLLVPLVAAALWSRRALSDPPSRSASAVSGAGHVLASDPPAERGTPMPARTEWSGASPAILERPLPHGCEAKLLREWLRLRCSGRRFASVGVVSGDAHGVALWLAPGKDPEGGLAELILPLRPGDRRILQVTELASDALHGSGEQRLSFIVSEQWPTREAGPIVTAR